MFKEPLHEKEVIIDTKSAEKAYEIRKYKYTNDKLIKILGITLEEQQHLKTIIFSSKEKYRRCVDDKKAKQKDKRRNENGLTKK